MEPRNQFYFTALILMFLYKELFNNNSLIDKISIVLKMGSIVSTIKYKSFFDGSFYAAYGVCLGGQ